MKKQKYYFPTSELQKIVKNKWYLELKECVRSQHFHNIHFYKISKNMLNLPFDEFTVDKFNENDVPE